MRLRKGKCCGTCAWSMFTTKNPDGESPCLYPWDGLPSCVNKTEMLYNCGFKCPCWAQRAKKGAGK